MIKSFIWSFLEQGGTKIVQLLVQIVLARLISPEAFGILAILLVFTNIADAIAQSGLGMALVQKSDATKKDYTTAFWLSLLLATIVFIVLWFIAPVLALVYQEQSLEVMLHVLSFVVFLNSANSVQRAYLQRHMEFKKLFQANVVTAVLSGVFGIGAAILGFGIWALVIQTLAQSLCACITLLVVVPWKPTFAFDKLSAKHMYSYGWKICVTGILNVIYTGVSELIIGKACSVTDLGYYSQGRKWPNAAISLITNALQNVFFPAFASLQNDLVALRDTMKKSLIAGSFLIVPVSFFFTAVAEPMVALLLTETWLPCVPVFQSLCIANSLMLLQVINLRAYMALGDSGLYMRLQIIKVTLNVVIIGLAALLTKDIYIVAVVSAVLSVFNVIFIDLHSTKRVHGYARLSQIKDILPIYLIAAVAGAVSYAITFLKFSYIAELVLMAIVFVSIYLLLSVVFKVQGAKECFQLLNGLLDRKNNN